MESFVGSLAYGYVTIRRKVREDAYGNVLRNIRLYSGSQGTFMEKDRVEAFCFRALTSWSLEKEVAESFKGGKESPGILFEGYLGVFTPYLDVSWISRFPHEKEILMSPSALGGIIGDGRVEVDKKRSTNCQQVVIFQSCMGRPL